MISTEFDLFGHFPLKNAQYVDEEEGKEVGRCEEVIGSGLKHNLSICLAISEEGISNHRNQNANVPNPFSLGVEGSSFLFGFLTLENRYILEKGKHYDSDGDDDCRHHLAGLQFQGFSFFDPAEEHPYQHHKEVSEVPPYGFGQV